AGAFTKGDWCHFVITREADTLRIYRNHNLYFNSIDNFYGGTLGDAVDLVFSASPHRFKGAIDDLRLYNKRLAQSEIDLLWFEKRPFVFNDPKPTDAYVQGSTLSANWQYDTTQVSDSIIVQYSINSGPWISPVHSGLAYEYYSNLNLNFPPGTTIEFRVYDKADPSKLANSGQMIMSEYDWVEVAPTLPWNSKDGAGLLTYNGKMWLLGGWDPPYHPPVNTHNEIWSSTDGANWNYEGDAPWPARHCGGWMVYDNAMWVVGGDPQSGCLADAWKSTDGINWTLIQDTLSPSYAKKHNTNYAALPNKMIMMGGSSCGMAMPVAFNEVWESADGATWNQLPDAPWSGRSMQINYCVDDTGAIWILGGAGEHDRRSYNDVWKTTDGINWIEVNEAAPWMGRYWHLTSWFDQKIWVVSGVATGTEVNDVWYSEDGISWHELKSTTGNWPAGTRHAASTTVFDNALWYMCGINTNNAWKIVNTTQVSSTEELTPDSNLFSVYPNPSSQFINLSTPKNWNRDIEIINYMGKTELSQKGMSNGSTVNIDNLTSGIYLIRFFDIQGRMQGVTKLIKLE
ncbi:MAG: T9SS type A sorting domain-containing protein, partial [Crocinitomicaceae bacterium]